MQENSADAKYEISRAVKADLAAIARIYNASVLERNATATPMKSSRMTHTPNIDKKRPKTL